jgi:hypothetical protein
MQHPFKKSVVTSVYHDGKCQLTNVCLHFLLPVNAVPRISVTGFHLFPHYQFAPRVDPPMAWCCPLDPIGSSARSLGHPGMHSSCTSLSLRKGGFWRRRHYLRVNRGGRQRRSFFDQALVGYADDGCPCNQNIHTLISGKAELPCNRFHNSTSTPWSLELFQVRDGIRQQERHVRSLLRRSGKNRNGV